MSSWYKRIEFKIVLAAVSGFLCDWIASNFDPDNRPFTYYGISGALFAAGVLFPYLYHHKLAWLRGIGLIVLSTMSYWCANEVVWAASGDSLMPDPRGFLAASLVGAAIVLAGARFIIPLHRSMKLAAAGFPAAIIGGLAFALLDDSLFYLAFAIWHSLMALAIYFAEQGPVSLGDGQ